MATQVRKKRNTVRVALYTDIHAKLLAQAAAQQCTLPRLLSDLVDLMEIASECARIEVYFGDRREAPVVTIWMPTKTQQDGNKGEEDERVDTNRHGLP